jgi:hypothetical protein
MVRPQIQPNFWQTVILAMFAIWFTILFITIVSICTTTLQVNKIVLCMSLIVIIPRISCLASLKPYQPRLMISSCPFLNFHNDAFYFASHLSLMAICWLFWMSLFRICFWYESFLQHQWHSLNQILFLHNPPFWLLISRHLDMPRMWSWTAWNKIHLGQNL